jgi:ABC-type transport system involved in multi-copper enzyme maturation permease subunit
MKTRILKELRSMAPYLMVSPAAILLAYWNGRLSLAWLGLALLLASVQSFGHEHGWRSVDWLLAQPLTRRRIWGEILLALGIFMGLFAALTLGLGIGAEWIRWRIIVSSVDASYEFGPFIISCCVSFLLTSACMTGLVLGGFWMGLAVRHAHTATGAALVIPIILALLWQAAATQDISLYNDVFDPCDETYYGNIDLLIQWAPPLMAWGFFSLIASWIHIKHLEV